MTDVKLTPQQEHALLLLRRSRRAFLAEFEPLQGRLLKYRVLYSLEQLGLITWPQTVGVDLIELTGKGRSVVECLAEVSA